MSDIRGADMSMIFQEPLSALTPVYTIGQQVAEAILIHNDVSSKQADRRAVELLALVGIPNPAQRAKAFPHEFSGGMRQRIMIALALVLNPAFVVADEPTTALDVLVEAQILSILADLKRNFDTSLLLITHNLGIVAEACERVAVMYAGRIVEEGDARQVFSDPSHPYTRELLRSTISLSTTALHYIPGSPPDLVEPPSGCHFHPRCPSAMQVCGVLDPVEVRAASGQRVSCWLHGPDELIPPGGTAPLQRQELASADEA
jgi:peptide/nickel transport system ATP-binding protein